MFDLVLKLGLARPAQLVLRPSNTSRRSAIVELAQIVGSVRRQLCLVAVSAQVALFLDRL